jgi:hypothetical protein
MTTLTLFSKGTREQPVRRAAKNAKGWINWKTDPRVQTIIVQGRFGRAERKAVKFTNQYESYTEDLFLANNGVVYSASSRDDVCRQLDLTEYMNIGLGSLCIALSEL